MISEEKRLYLEAQRLRDQAWAWWRERDGLTRQVAELGICGADDAELARRALHTVAAEVHFRKLRRRDIL